MIHLITYGYNKFEHTKKRLYREAYNTGWFDTITLYGPKDLDEDFKFKFKHILEQPRGGGYWIWKSHIINKKLNEIADGDILIYLDAGCTINSSGKNRFDEYIELLNLSNEACLSFQLKFIEKNWTSTEIFNYFNMDINSKIANTGQIHSTVLIMKNNKKLLNLMDIYNKVLHDKPLLFTDHYNKIQKPFFIENRHDQSIFSVIRKIYNPIHPLLLKDETWFEPFKSKESLKYPFWATRLRY